MASRHGRVREIQIHHEHAVARIGRLTVAVGLTGRIAAVAVDGIRLDADELETFDLLRGSIFEDLEVLGAAAPR